MNVTATTASHPAPPQPAPDAARPGGSKLPASGKHPPEAAMDAGTRAIKKAVEQINAYLRDSKREIEFQVDRESGRTIMRVMDASGEVVRQVPSEEVLQIATTLGSGGFHSIDQLA